jgi:hypothetical protein
MESYLHQAWFFGIRPGHDTMVEAKMRQADPRRPSSHIQRERLDPEQLPPPIPASADATAL